MKNINILANILLILGGLNWGLIGLFDFNVLMWIFIPHVGLQHLIYIIVGLAAVWKIIYMGRECRCNNKKKYK